MKRKMSNQSERISDNQCAHNALSRQSPLRISVPIIHLQHAQQQSMIQVVVPSVSIYRLSKLQTIAPHKPRKPHTCYTQCSSYSVVDRSTERIYKVRWDSDQIWCRFEYCWQFRSDSFRWLFEIDVSLILLRIPTVAAEWGGSDRSTFCWILIEQSQCSKLLRHESLHYQKCRKWWKLRFGPINRNQRQTIREPGELVTIDDLFQTNMVSLSLVCPSPLEQSHWRRVTSRSRRRRCCVHLHQFHQWCRRITPTDTKVSNWNSSALWFNHFVAVVSGAADAASGWVSTLWFDTAIYVTEHLCRATWASGWAFLQWLCDYEL